MKLIVFSDIHNNYYALEKIFLKVKSEAAMDIKVIFLGDIIGYLKFDPRIIPLLKKMRNELNMVLLAGNHDTALFNNLGLTNIKLNPSVALEQTVSKHLEYKNELLELVPFLKMGKMQLDFEKKKYVLSHAGISDIYNHYYYPDKKFLEKYKESFEPNVNYIFGHTHRPFIINNTANGFINVGSIGLPRDNDPRLCYGEIDESGKASIKRIFYNLDEAYEYNKDLNNNFQNKIYFASNSQYIDGDLLEMEDEIFRVVEMECQNFKLFNRAIYVEENDIYNQIFNIKFGSDIVYLLRTAEKEEIFTSINQLVRRLRR